MRTIVAGGSGLLGRALVAELAAAGEEVVVLSRSPEQVTGLPATARAVRWDGRTAAGWGELAGGARAVVNLAGENLASGRWTAERRRRIRESRVQAGAAVLEAVRQAAAKPSVVIQASAVGYYGPRGDELVDEATSPGRDFLAEVCVAWEASTAPVEELGVRRAVIRTGVVLSRAGGALPRLLLPFRFFAGGPLGSGRQWYPWIALADEIAAIRFLLERPEASGAFNLTAPEPVTNAELARALGRALGRPALLPTPALALRLLLGDMATVVLDGQRAVPRRLEALGFTWRYPTLDRALAAVLG
jgi:uncharacterized protein (TIGR01777 family)